MLTLCWVCVSGVINTYPKQFDHLNYKAFFCDATHYLYCQKVKSHIHLTLDTPAFVWILFCDIYDVCRSHVKKPCDVCCDLMFVVNGFCYAATFVVDRRQLLVLWQLWRLSSRQKSLWQRCQKLWLDEFDVLWDLELSLMTSALQQKTY